MPSDSPPLPSPSLSLAPIARGTMIVGRYAIGDPIRVTAAIQRYRGFDMKSGQSTPMPVVIVCQNDTATEENNDDATWPGVEWEKRVLSRSWHLSLPRVLDSFRDEQRSYLIEEMPEGRAFWDAWEETPISWPRRCTWLIQLAETIERLHRAGAMVEWSPDRVVISPMEQAVLTDLSTLLPVPVPAEAAIPTGRCSAPELQSHYSIADARASLYSFGAMVHALLLGRELTDLDFTPMGRPRPYAERFPDAHPLIARLLGRTFAFDVTQRFPSADRWEDDPCGARSLIELLEVCTRNLDAIRLEISAWTSTGLVRSGNEDAVAVVHSAESGLEENDDFALLVLADGMGGMAGGEIAANVTIQTVRDYFLKHPPFTELVIQTRRPAPEPQAAGSKFDPDATVRRHKPKPPAEESLTDTTTTTRSAPDRKIVRDAICEANRAVLARASADQALRGMGCTAEVVLIDGRQVTVGHVGDSRVYHYRRGKLTQVTQDQTLVSRLVQLGQLTEEEAELHPQRSELQQAIGGRSDVYADEHVLEIEPGDWLLACTDGLTNMLRPAAITDVLQAAGSAEKAARRLVNQAIIAGGTDNVSLIVVRVC